MRKLLSSTQNRVRKSLTPTPFVLTGIAVCIIIITLLATASFLSSRIKEYSFSRSNSSTWMISQTEILFLRFSSDLREALDATENGAEASAPDADRILRSFDLLFSQIDSLNGDISTKNLPIPIRDDLNRIFVVRDELADTIDNERPYSRETLLRLVRQTEVEQQLIRKFVLDTLHLSVQDQDVARSQLNKSLTQFLLVSTILLIFASITAVSMMYLWRENGIQAQNQSRISSYLFNVVEASQDAIVVLNDKLIITEFNTAAQEILGCDRHSAHGRSIIESFTPPKWRTMFREKLEAILAGTDTEEDRFSNSRAWAQRINGDPFPAELTVVRERGIDNEPILIGFLRDTSDEVEARARARDLLAQAQSDATAKSRFLATMSHEMRTPLHGVIASLDMIDVDAQSPDNANFIQIARDASKAALEQTEDVLDIAKQDTTFDPSSPTRYNALSVIQNIVAQVSALAQSRGNTISVSWDGSEANFGLRRSYSRAIYNLLSNAIKFTENGNITIHGSNTEINGVMNTRVEISDTGIGIVETETSLIFQDFYSNAQSPTNSRNAVWGTGLGLGITQRSLDAMGGTLDYSSQHGVGSSFWITFPASVDRPAQSPGDANRELQNNRTELHLTQADIRPSLAELAGKHSAPSNLLRGRTVLIIEDHPTNRQLIEHMATRLGCHVETAEDGIKGLQRAFNTQFDLILTDINMPNLDGLDTAACIRTMSRSQHSCIVAVTAHADIDANEDVHIFEHGIDGLVSKPFTQEQLQDKLSKILEEHMELRPHHAVSPPEYGLGLHDFLEMGLPEDKAQALINRACADIRKVQSSLNTALEHQQTADFVQLGTLAHHAAGGIYFLGGMGIGDTLIQIEKICGQDNRERLKGLEAVLSLGFSEMETQLATATMT